MKSIIDYYKKIKNDNEILERGENFDEIDINNLYIDNEDEFFFV